MRSFDTFHLSNDANIRTEVPGAKSRALLERQPRSKATLYPIQGRCPLP